MNVTRKKIRTTSPMNQVYLAGDGVTHIGTCCGSCGRWVEAVVWGLPVEDEERCKCARNRVRLVK